MGEPSPSEPDPFDIETLFMTDDVKTNPGEQIIDTSFSSALSERYQIDVSEEGKIRETVNFKLPSILVS